MSDIDRVFGNPKFQQEIIRLMEKWAKDTGRLTGEEWYKRFEQEVHGTVVADGLACKEAALLLARRAAGMDT